MSRSGRNKPDALSDMEILACGVVIILVVTILNISDAASEMALLVVLVWGAAFVIVAIVHAKRLVDDGSLYILYQMRQLKRLAHDWREELCFLLLGVVGVLCIICLMRHFVRLARDDELWFQHKARERRVAIAALRVEAEELARDARREAALRAEAEKREERVRAETAMISRSVHNDISDAKEEAVETVVWGDLWFQLKAKRREAIAALRAKTEKLVRDARREVALHVEAEKRKERVRAEKELHCREVREKSARLKDCLKENDTFEANSLTNPPRIQKAPINGKGILEHPNGDTVEGEWKDGKLCGEAFYKTSDGKVWVMKPISLEVID
jgi:hypothetical protein